MRVLGLDLSTSVGWCLGRRGRMKFGTYLLPKPGPESLTRRFVALEAWLQQFYSRQPFDVLAFEQPILPFSRGNIPNQFAEIELLVGLAVVARTFAGRSGTPVISVPWQQVKITVAGHVRATKDEMVVVAMRDWNWPVANDHEADAGGVAVWALNQLEVRV